MEEIPEPAPLNERKPAPLPRQALAAIIASTAAVTVTLALYFLLASLLGIEFVVPAAETPSGTRQLNVTDLLFLSAGFSALISIIFLTVATSTRRPAPIFAALSAVALFAFLLIPLGFPNPPIPTATKASLVGMQFVGTALLVTILVARGLLVTTPEEEIVALPDLCVYAPGRRGEMRTSEVILPGHAEPVELTYEVFDGVAVLEGGIILGRVEELEEEVRRARQGPSAGDDVPGIGTARQPLVAVRARNKLWDAGRVPFQTNLNPTLTRQVQDAIAHIEANTNLRFVSASNDYKDRVVFVPGSDPGVAYSALGRQEGVQYISLPVRFDTGGIVHEILHSVGVLHEHTRNDRDAYIQVNDGTAGTTKNICPGRGRQFAKRNAGARDLGPYDYDSIMHYRAWAFARSNGAVCNPPLSPTIEPLDPAILRTRLGSARFNPPYLSAGDIAGLNELYPVGVTFGGGSDWDDDSYATAVAFGDVDGDGVEELIVTRKSPRAGRYYILGNASNPANPFPTLYVGGREWEQSGDCYATCCATGDLDGDGQDEVVIGRRASKNQRFEVRKFVSQDNTQQLFAGATDWDPDYYTTDVAVGIDRFATPLIGVARFARSHSRFYLFAGAADNFKLLFKGGARWAGDNYATGIAFGDVTGDGYLEVGVTRRHAEPDDSARFLLYKATGGDYTNLRLLTSGGSDWDDDHYATSIAFGDVDGDGVDEIAVTRKAGTYGRFLLFAYDGAFELVRSFGDRWGSAYYATDIALGDIDGDGRAELVVGRNAVENGRFYLLDDQQTNFQPLLGEGHQWSPHYWATAVAVGDADGMGRARHIAVAREAASHSRFIVYAYNP